MNSKVWMLKSVVATVALAAGVSGMARADDSSMNPFTGDSYAYFNGGNLPKTGNPVFDQAPSAWRQSHQEGLPDSYYMGLVTFGTVWKPAPILDMAPSSWRQAHPQGPSERDMQAAASEAPAWHAPDQSAPSALASTNTDTPRASPEPLRTRIARFFHVTPANQATSTN